MKFYESFLPRLYRMKKKETCINISCQISKLKQDIY